jgi:hypothetical protein
MHTLIGEAGGVNGIRPPAEEISATAVNIDKHVSDTQNPRVA